MKVYESTPNLHMYNPSTDIQNGYKTLTVDDIDKKLRQMTKNDNRKMSNTRKSSKVFKKAGKQDDIYDNKIINLKKNYDVVEAQPDQNQSIENQQINQNQTTLSNKIFSINRKKVISSLNGRNTFYKVDHKNLDQIKKNMYITGSQSKFQLGSVKDKTQKKFRSTTNDVFSMTNLVSSNQIESLNSPVSSTFFLNF